jgi:pimeloyl-ACP methyl ester carboxylesterase
MNVVVNGLMTSYQKTGKGKALVFLPGWGDTAKTFSALATELQGKYEIYLLDLPGFGGTQAPPRAWDLKDYADFLEAWTKKVGVKPLALVGHSYGGAVAIYAASQGQISDKLVLLASAGIRNKQPLKRKFLAAAAKGGKIPLLVLPAGRRARIKRKFYGSIGSDLMLLPHMQDTFKKIINQDITDPARRINRPTLLIYGAADKATPAGDGRALNRAISGSKLEIIEAGHFPHQEQPGQVADLIRNFLNGKGENA